MLNKYARERVRKMKRESISSKGLTTITAASVVIAGMVIDTL
ncbi:hypothetical protein [Bacillus thermotolerans]|nr:hypothetical protein [Bacillus thermotolerans]KKB40096.1 hypothetical protein QY96_02512 [Bacillus thermotolerans]